MLLPLRAIVTHPDRCTYFSRRNRAIEVNCVARFGSLRFRQIKEKAERLFLFVRILWVLTKSFKRLWLNT